MNTSQHEPELREQLLELDAPELSDEFYRQVRTQAAAPKSLHGAAAESAFAGAVVLVAAPALVAAVELSTRTEPQANRRRLRRRQLNGRRRPLRHRVWRPSDDRPLRIPGRPKRARPSADRHHGARNVPSSARLRRADREPDVLCRRRRRPPVQDRDPPRPPVPGISGRIRAKSAEPRSVQGYRESLRTGEVEPSAKSVDGRPAYELKIRATQRPCRDDSVRSRSKHLLSDRARG